ncbi:MBL fold metallo-hydrolase [Kaustia mangrovi]|uniref:MBL fold metallo-hydrolase n=1 Tax=Kaustia mangrovi TaxID=2593653 RepID=A0A7S8C1C4_9HYPH|nr:MBL fold metallo-hydrolase [Kaustia mangrovi]QPC41568.1 MBL fold metallo-hydrolase [Kaustia mangrovi]
MGLKITVLGCGSSGGVPRIGNNWGVCDPTNPKNRRRRCSILVERENGRDATRVLVDSSPDVREQLLDAGVSWLDGVIYTHDHADHTHGLDELRVIAINGRQRVRVWADERTERSLRTRFGYCFETPPGSNYPPILDAHRIVPPEPVAVDGPGGIVEAVPFELDHGDIRALGFRFDGLAYTPDLHDIPEESIAALEDLDVWIVDALRPTPHPSHFDLNQALDWIDRLKPRRAILTNMHVDLDYEALKRELPDNVVPAHDGLTVVAE